MSFRAGHDAIRQFGGSLADLTDDADRAVSYSRDGLDIGYGEGRMFFTVVETATSVREALMDNYRLLARFVDHSAAEVGRAADHYRDTDQAAAARVDAAY